MSDNQMQEMDSMSASRKSYRPTGVRDDESSVLGTEDMPVDVKKLKGSLNEQAEMLKVVKEFEKVYFEGKANYNKLDGITMNSDITMKSLRHCFKLNTKHLAKEEPGFDDCGMEQRLDALYKEVQDTNLRYNGIKGEEMLLSEQIINKDTSAFKLQRIIKARRDQVKFYDKMDDIDDIIYDQEKRVEDTWQEYEDWNEELFRKMLGKTVEVIKLTSDKFKAIDEQMARMTKGYDQIVLDMEIVQPFTEEHKSRITKIQLQIAQVGQTLQKGRAKIEKERKAEGRHQEGHENCLKIVDLIDKLNEENDLVKLVEVVDSLGDLVENHHEWLDLYNRLKALEEDQIIPGQSIVETQAKKLTKYIQDVKLALKEAFEDLISRIRKQGGENLEKTRFQEERLNDFEERNLNDPTVSMNIAKADLLFLKKEVTRYDVSIGMVLSICESNVENCNELENERQEKLKAGDDFIEPETINTLERCYKHLCSQDTVEIPRIKKNVDSLVAYNIKALKNKLNDDNQKSQAQISAMKKRFEDLQKYIDALNGKVVLVRKNIAALHTQFNDEDLEKDNDFKNILTAKCDECDGDINGDPNAPPVTIVPASEDGGYSEQSQSMISRKKAIISAINKMVNQFNENNKLIKDSNKSPKTDMELNAIISKSKELQDFCTSIDKKVTSGKEYAVEIEAKLDAIIDPKIPNAVEKFTEKNNLIDDCDELFDANEAKVNKLEELLKSKISECDDMIEKITNVSPLENPGLIGNQQEEFVKVVSANMDKAQNLLQEYRNAQSSLMKLQDKLMDDIQPLNELGEREVKAPEIEEIMEKMKILGGDFDDLEKLILPLGARLKECQDAVKDMIDQEKNKSGKEANDRILDLNNLIHDLEILKSDAGKKLEEYKKLIDEAKEKFGEDDPILHETLKHLEEEAAAIEQDIKNLDDEIAALQDKRDELKNLNDDQFANPSEHTPKQVQDLCEKVAKEKEKVLDQRDREQAINDDLDKRIEDIKKLTSENTAKAKLNETAKDLAKDLNGAVKDIKDLLNTLPEQIADMLASLEEQKKDTQPDEQTADYFKKAEIINIQIDGLKKLQQQVKKVDVAFPPQEKQAGELVSETRKSNDFERLKDLIGQMEDQKEIIDKTLDEIKQCDTGVQGIKKEMSDCLIPLNIAKRAEEIAKLSKNIDSLNEDFRNFKNHELNDRGANEYQQEIRDIINDLMQRLDESDNDKRELKKFQKSVLEKYGQKDFVQYKNAPIIAEVRKHKEDIKGTQERLDDLGDYFKESVQRKDEYHAIDTIKTKCDKDLDAINDILDKLPLQIQKMLETLEEMLKGSSPENADYFDKKKQIEEWIKILNDGKFKLDQIDEDFPNQEEAIDDLIAHSRENNAVDHLAKIKVDFVDVQTPIEEMLKTCNEVTVIVDQTKEEMDDCELPANIQKRAADIITFNEKLAKIKETFEQLKEVDEEIDEEFMNPESEAEIRKLVLEIDAKIYDFDIEQEQFSNKQTDVLEKYRQKDFVSIDNAPIVAQVREHKLIIDDAIARLKDLDELVRDALARKEAYAVINELGDLLQADLCALKDMFGSMPEEVEGMLVTLQEMYNGSIPDESADYHDLRQEIEEWIFGLKAAKTNMNTCNNKYQKKEKSCLKLIEEAKEPTDTEGLEKYKQQFEIAKGEVDKILEEAEKVNDSVMEIKNNMGECLIPDNITKRANEIDSFKEKLNKLQYDFFDFKIEYAKNSMLSKEMKKEIKTLIDEIDRRIYGFDEEKKEFLSFQKGKLENYSTKDFISIDNPPIIIEIREFKAKIGDANERLQDLEAFINECVSKKEAYQVINTLNKDIELDLHNLKEFFKSLPGEIKDMLATLKEMALGSEPNESADYFNSKEQIHNQTKSLIGTQDQIKTIEKDFNETTAQIGVLVSESHKKDGSVSKLQKLSRDFEKMKVAIQEILQRSNSCRDQVEEIKAEMDECEIPKTISLRADEINQFNDKLEQIQKQFVEIQAGSIEDNSSDAKAAIRAFVDEINKRLYGLQEEQVDFTEYQKSTLEQHSPKEFSDLKNAPIIKAVREHKQTIADAYERLQDLEDFVSSSKAKKTQLLNIDNLAKLCRKELDNISTVTFAAPNMIQKLYEVLKQMLLAAAPLKGYPNETADYWNEKDDITGNQTKLNQINSEIEKIDSKFNQQESEVKALIERSKNDQNIECLTEVADSLQETKIAIQDTLAEAQKAQADITEIQKEMDDQRIPKTVRTRQDDILTFQDILSQIKDRFKKLQKHETSDEKDQKIIIDLSHKLAEFDKEDVELVNYQVNNLQMLTRENFLDLDQSVELIPKIKTHKDNITDATERLKLLGELIDRTYSQMCSQGDIAAFAKQLSDDISNLKGVLSDLPPKIESLLQTLKEMKNGSEPDDSADYWEERAAIENNTMSLLTAQKALQEIEDTLLKKEGDINNQLSKSKKTQDIPTLIKIQETLKDYKDEINDLLNKAYDQRDNVQETKNKMNDCELPVNINMRANEIDQFREKLDRIIEDFKDLKQADEDFDGTSESEEEIKTLIAQIEKKVQEFQQELQEFNRYQKGTLGKYTRQDFLDYNNAPIIIEVREFKARIGDAFAKLKDIEALTNDLNSKLIIQDIENATKLLEVKNKKLRERLEIAKTELSKINKCGDEMDGNCSRNEEEEFIEALKDEMPEVFKNIEGNFEQIDKVDQIIIEIKTTKSIEMMQTLKIEIDDASIKVEQCEGLVNKLENEIIEWDALKKLCRRDEELEEIDHLLKDFQNDLETETGQMYPKLDQNSKKLELSTSPNDIEDFTKLVEGIKEYIGDVEKLQKEVCELLEEKDDCFDEFDNDVPKIVKKERDIRRKQKALIMTPSRRQSKKVDPEARESGSNLDEDEKPSDMYYMIEVNCQYRKRIHEMLKNLRELNKKRRELEDKWGPFKRELNKVKEVKVYKAVKGDAVDELFAFHLNKHQLNLPIKRLGPGKYLFGTKQILAKIINGKLVIRVGGGYMSADEFIEQYGPMEILKIQQAEERANPDNAQKTPAGARTSMSIRQSMQIKSPQGGVGTMADIKAQMRESMTNIKVYGDDPQLNTNRGSPTNRTSLGSLEKKASANRVTAGSPRRIGGGLGSPKAGRRGSPRAGGTK